MAVMKIGTTDVVPVVAQTNPAGRVAQEAARQQSRVSRQKPHTPYSVHQEESITCRETSTGTYEAILTGNDLAIHGKAEDRKGQIIDLWI
jgi:hypothetical protein